MKKLLLIFSFFLLIANIAGAQHGNIWTFWDGQGLDFTNGKPKVITSKISLICSQDATAVPSTISDCEGKLLFYSAGSRTLNYKHDTIKGAVHCFKVNSISNPKSAHAIMERKDSLGKYILVYGVPHLNVQLVDMKANGGQGVVYKVMADIEKDIFNNGAYTKSAFDIQYHPNDTDFWIISRPTSSFFRVIHYSPIDGVKDVIDSYDVRNSFTLQGNNGIAVRFSRRGDLVVAGAHYDGLDPNSAYIYNFDRNTGIISNPEPICDTSVQIEAQITDFEFSPNDTFVYFKSNPLKSNNNYYLIQTKVRGNEKVKHAKQLYKNIFNGLYGLSLGPDNKIYTGEANSKNIHIIHQPDRPFPKCNFKENEILMTNNLGHFFPKNRAPLHQIYINNSSVKGYCNDTTWFSLKGDTGYYSSYSLSWGDGAVEVLDNSKLSNVFHVYQSEGNYEIILRALTAECKAPIWRYDSAFVKFNEPRAMLLQDEITTYCGRKEIYFHDSIGASNYFNFLVKNLITNDTVYFKSDTAKIYELSNRSLFRNRSVIVNKNDSFIFLLNVSNTYECSAKDSFIYFPDIDTFPVVNIELAGENTGCAPVEISIKNNSKYADSILINWGDGSSLNFTKNTNEILHHTFDNKITFHPVIVVKNKDGCIDSMKLSYEINILNPAQLTYQLNIDSTCEFGKITLEDKSENSDYVITIFKDINSNKILLYDSAIVVGNILNFSVNDYKNISIYRYAQNNLCNQDSSQTIELYPKKTPQIKLVSSDSTLNMGGSKCEPVNVSFQDLLDEGNTNTWIFYRNLDETPQKNKKIYNEILTAGSYQTILIDSANNGCINADTLIFSILPQPIYDYILDIKMLCEKWQANISVNAKDRVLDSVFISWDSDKIQKTTIGNSPEFNINYQYDFVTKDSIRNIYISTKHQLGCIEYDTFSFEQKSYRILEAPNVLGVSVNNPNEIVLDWNPVPFAKNYEITKDNKSKIIINNPPYISYEATDKKYFGYHISAIDTCGIKGDSGRFSQTILLQGKVLENLNMQDEAVLTWNPYENWQNGVTDYTLELQDENGMFRNIATLDSNGFEYTDVAFSHALLNEYCYRITANENGGNNYKSTSNMMCLGHKPWLVIPNAFSPNNDGLNDIFKPHFLSIRYIKMNITNQWGELVLEYDGKNPEWDGTFKGNPAPIGPYIIQISALHLNGRLVNYKGIVNLIR